MSDQKFSKNLANALFQSKLIYGIQVWGLSPQYLIKKVQVLQNKAARVVQGYKSYRINNETLLKNMNWLPVNKLVILHVSKLVHQIIHTGEPAYFYNKMVKTKTNNTRSNTGNKLGPKPKTIGGSKFFQKYII